MSFEITSFNFGVPDENGDCVTARNFVALDSDGVYDYDSSSTRLCGYISSGNLTTITTESNVMGLLLSGIQGGPIQASFVVSFS